MAWDDSYRSIMRNIYWNPTYVGLRSFKWSRQNPDELVTIRDSSKLNPNGPIYSRASSDKTIWEELCQKEEILNHFLTLTLALMPDQVFEEVFLTAAGVVDRGPFESVSRDLPARYGWGGFEAAQPDAFVVSNSTVAAIEMKLLSPSSVDQLLKYIALFLCEEKKSGRKENLLLTFLVPPKHQIKVLKSCGLGVDQIIPQNYVAQNLSKLKNQQIRKILEGSFFAAEDVCRRLRVEVLTWPTLHQRINLVRDAQDESVSAQQCLKKLLEGFVRQLEVHAHTGIVRQVAGSCSEHELTDVSPEQKRRA